MSLLFCAVAAGSCLTLLARFENVNTRDPVDAVRAHPLPHDTRFPNQTKFAPTPTQVPYLDAARQSYNYAPTAVALALPRGMFYHAAALVPAQALAWVARATCIWAAVAISVLVVLAGLMHGKWSERYQRIALHFPILRRRFWCGRSAHADSDMDAYDQV